MQLKELNGPFVQSQDAVAIARRPPIVFGFFYDRNRNAALLGDDADGFGKAAAFDSHHEIEDASTGPAAEPGRETAVRVDVERRSLRGVKRAARYVSCPALLERHVVRHDTNNVALIPNVISKAARKLHHLSCSLVIRFVEGAVG